MNDAENQVAVLNSPALGHVFIGIDYKRMGEERRAIVEVMSIQPVVEIFTPVMPVRKWWQRLWAFLNRDIKEFF